MFSKLTLFHSRYYYSMFNQINTSTYFWQIDFLPPGPNIHLYFHFVLLTDTADALNLSALYEFPQGKLLSFVLVKQRNLVLAKHWALPGQGFKPATFQTSYKPNCLTTRSQLSFPNSHDSDASPQWHSLASVFFNVGAVFFEWHSPPFCFSKLI